VDLRLDKKPAAPSIPRLRGQLSSECTNHRLVPLDAAATVRACPLRKKRRRSATTRAKSPIPSSSSARGPVVLLRQSPSTLPHIPLQDLLLQDLLHVVGPLHRGHPRAGLDRRAVPLTDAARHALATTIQMLPASLADPEMNLERASLAASRARDAAPPIMSPTFPKTPRAPSAEAARLKC